jgi:preprotein translocase subunit SecD
MKLNRVLLWFIIVLVGLTTLISFPSLPVKFSIGDKVYDRIIKGPDLFGKKMDIKLGLDLQGGSFISLRADMTGVPENEKSQRIEAARKVMENRVNQFGISEAYVYSSISGNDYKINIELPGAGADTENQISVLKQTAKLEFFRVKEPQPEIPENFDSLPVDVQLNYLYDKLNISGSDLKSASVTAPTSGGSAPITGDSRSSNGIFRRRF